MTGFDPAAEFLLDLGWGNLFEQADHDGGKWRCKGCYEIVAPQDREHHFNHHRGVRRRSETFRQQRIRRERVARLTAARMRGAA